MKPRVSKPVTPQRIERALDTVARWIVIMGKRGEELLPLYDRLEDELRAVRAKEDRLESIRRRALRQQAESPAC